MEPPAKFIKKFTEILQITKDNYGSICYNMACCPIGTAGKDVCAMLCPNCGKEFDEEYTTCPECGWEAVLSEGAADQTLSESLPEDTVCSPLPNETAAEDADLTEAAADAETSVQDGDSSEEESPEEESEPAEDMEETSTESDPTQPSEEAEEPSLAVAAEEPVKKKRSILPVVLGAIVGLLVIIVVCLTITLTTLSKTGKMPAFVNNIQSIFHREHFKGDADALQVKNQDGDEIATLNNEQFSFYYWGEVYYFLQSSGMAFDPSQPLSEQDYAEGKTWQDFFMENAATSALQVEAMKAEAAAAGYEMPETYQDEYNSILESMPDYAAQAGFTDDQGNGDLLAYVQDSYGAGATVESFQQYLYDSYYVTAYSDHLYQEVTVDDSELDSWYDENQEMYATYGILKSDLPNVNVRHILIAPEAAAEDATEAELQKAKEEAREEAERILKEWEDGEATEESFGDLANTYSTDGGSNTTGGLYEDVYPGQMVPTFNDWCFDESRKAGDTGIVESDYGYHIMYYVGATENFYWKQVAESDLHYKLYDESLQALTDKYASEFADSFALTTPTAITKLAESTTPGEADGTTIPAETDGTTAPEEAEG